MSEILTQHTPESGVEQNSENILQLIESRFGNRDFEDFLAYVNTLEEQQKINFLRDFNTVIQNSDFIQYINNQYLPYDTGTFEDCYSRIGAILGNRIGIAEGEVERAEGEVIQESSNLEQEIQITINYWREKGIYNDILLGLPADASTEEQLAFIVENYIAILERAREYSDTEFVAVYEGLQNLQQSGVSLPQLRDFEAYYGEVQQTTFNPRGVIGRSSREDARLALGDGGNFQSISGNTLLGENGERIEVNGSTIDLSLTSDGGLSLEVGSFERPRTHELEVRESQLRAQLESNNERLRKLTNQENKLSRSRSGYEAIPNSELDTEAYQDAIATEFSAIIGNRLAYDIVRAIEQGINGIELKRLLVGYIDAQLKDISIRKEAITQENTQIERQIGKLVSRIETQRRLFAEKIAYEREQVEKTRNFYERLGVTTILGRIQGLLGRISTGFPLRIGNNIITGFNPSTFQFEGTFSPALGEQSPTDTLTQDVFLQLINQSLSGSIEEPFVRGSTGSIVYQLDGQQVGKQEFERRYAPIIGSPFFESQVLANWSQNTTEEDGVQ